MQLPLPNEDVFEGHPIPYPRREFMTEDEPQAIGHIAAPQINCQQATQHCDPTNMMVYQQQQQQQQPQQTVMMNQSTRPIPAPHFQMIPHPVQQMQQQQTHHIINCPPVEKRMRMVHHGGHPMNYPIDYGAGYYTNDPQTLNRQDQFRQYHVRNGRHPPPPPQHQRFM
ncbi:hypothetical protein ACOME3_005364 [Neoechinorhynchus agilis]